MLKNVKQPLTIIYDVTTTCPHNCQICCMGATCTEPDYNKELTPQERLSFISKQLAELKEYRDVRIDFSGGEIFWKNLEDNINLIKTASTILGKDKVGVSCSGININEKVAKELSGFVSDVEMTMDSLPGIAYKLRPLSYANAAAKAVPRLKKAGVVVGIQTVLAQSNSSEQALRALYDWLCKNNVDNWSLLRFYPSGRGADYPEEWLSDEECLRVVKFIQRMDVENPSANKPKIDFHYTMPGHEKHTNMCRCVKKSIGILPNGKVTACFWAVNGATEITHEKFYLGDVREQTLVEILHGEKAKYWTSGCHNCELNDEATSSPAA